MSLKLYKITTTIIEHPDYGARLKKNTDEIYSFFSFNRGNKEQIKGLDFVAGEGYTLENIKKTDFINCTPQLLFSNRFVEKVGNLLSEEMQFFPCNLICKDVKLDWFAARIIRQLPIIDKEETTYWEVDGKRMVRLVKYRNDIEEQFYIARDEEHIPYWVVSELFMDLCKKNGLQLLFFEV